MANNERSEALGRTPPVSALPPGHAPCRPLGVREFRSFAVPGFASARFACLVIRLGAPLPCFALVIAPSPQAAREPARRAESATLARKATSAVRLLTLRLPGVPGSKE